jgi:hypothetical protein
MHVALPAGAGAGWGEGRTEAVGRRGNKGVMSVKISVSHLAPGISITRPGAAPHPPPNTWLLELNIVQQSSYSDSNIVLHIQGENRSTNINSSGSETFPWVAYVVCILGLRKSIFFNIYFAVLSWRLHIGRFFAINNLVKGKSGDLLLFYFKDLKFLPHRSVIFILSSTFFQKRNKRVKR